jgi:hypothetical protein
LARRRCLAIQLEKRCDAALRSSHSACTRSWLSSRQSADKLVWSLQQKSARR